MSCASSRAPSRCQGTQPPRTRAPEWAQLLHLMPRPETSRSAFAHILQGSVMPACRTFLCLSRVLYMQFMTPDRHKVVMSPGQAPAPRSGARGGSSNDSDEQGKYRPRINPLRRALQKLLPGWFAPTLPVTTR